MNEWMDGWMPVVFCLGITTIATYYLFSYSFCSTCVHNNTQFPFQRLNGNDKHPNNSLFKLIAQTQNKKLNLSDVTIFFEIIFCRQIKWAQQKKIKTMKKKKGKKWKQFHVKNNIWQSKWTNANITENEFEASSNFFVFRFSVSFPFAFVFIVWSWPSSLSRCLVVFGCDFSFNCHSRSIASFVLCIVYWFNRFNVAILNI